MKLHVSKNGLGHQIEVFLMDNLYDLGTDVPYTDEDLEVLFHHKEINRNRSAQCAACRWLETDWNTLCAGPLTCAKWMTCGKCCPLTGRAELIDFERCPHFKVDPLMSH
jgi:hypothetical protein